MGIDTGGTYTDAVLFDETAGVVASGKSLTTKHDLAIGVGRAVASVLPQSSSDIELVSLSTTLATNAIVEAQGSPVCLMMVGQGAEALKRSDLSRALRGDPVVFIAGGHTAAGDEQVPLDEQAVLAAVEEHAPKVAAFAVASLFAVRNAAHEQRVRDIVRAKTGLPVTCSHELSSNLDAPRRALTALLNARLIPFLQQLILATHQMLKERGIAAPLMVVLGDGSLVAAEEALKRPVETILSGPAASAVGARYLSGKDNVLIADIGGTTTDIAILRNGWPALNVEGATVGGWRTMVEAVAVHTVGLGGDSEVHAGGGLALGPRRVVPLSLLAQDYPQTLVWLRDQRERSTIKTFDGRFALRLRMLNVERGALTPGELRLWDALGDGPTSLERLFVDHPLERQLRRLVEKGLVAEAGFTPSDAVHVLGEHTAWSEEAARLGAEIWLRRDRLEHGTRFGSIEDFCQAVVESMVLGSAEALVNAVLEEEQGQTLSEHHPLARRLVRQALAAGVKRESLLQTCFTLATPIVAIGAPAATYYPEVARRLHTELVLPASFEVANAVGAVASSVMQALRGLITSPSDGRFRAHVAGCVEDFPRLEAAVEFTEARLRLAVREMAERAGGDDIEIRVRRVDRSVPVSGRDLFLDTELTATAVGRPRTASVRADNGQP
jgi:N-methylhydantoinase A/oxoprolinase/acetone carboxylase beta subunit